MRCGGRWRRSTKARACSGFNRPLALLDRTDPGQPLLGFAEVIGGKQEVWEYAALVTSLDSEILTLGRLYHPGFETLPPAGRERGADLQLVELVCPAGRSRSAS